MAQAEKPVDPEMEKGGMPHVAPPTTVWRVVAAVVLVTTVLALGNAVGSRVQRLQCEERQREAKTIIKVIQEAQYTSHGEMGTYLGLERLLETEPVVRVLLADARYYAATGAADGEQFRFELVDTRQRVGAGPEDRWVLTDRLNVLHTVHGCGD